MDRCILMRSSTTQWPRLFTSSFVLHLSVGMPTSTRKREEVNLVLWRCAPVGHHRETEPLWLVVFHGNNTGSLWPFARENDKNKRIQGDWHINRLFSGSSRSRTGKWIQHIHFHLMIFKDIDLNTIFKIKEMFCRRGWCPRREVYRWGRDWRVKKLRTFFWMCSGLSLSLLFQELQSSEIPILLIEYENGWSVEVESLKGVVVDEHENEDQNENKVDYKHNFSVENRGVGISPLHDHNTKIAAKEEDGKGETVSISNQSW